MSGDGGEEARAGSLLAENDRRLFEILSFWSEEVDPKPSLNRRPNENLLCVYLKWMLPPNKVFGL